MAKDKIPCEIKQNKVFFSFLRTNTNKVQNTNYTTTAIVVTDATRKKDSPNGKRHLLICHSIYVIHTTQEIHFSIVLLFRAFVSWHTIFNSPYTLNTESIKKIDE